MIVVFGSINVDLVCRVASIVRPGETVLARSYATLHGGKGANQAVAAARGGLPVTMAGRVGDDDFGRMARDNLVREGIDVSGIRIDPEPTGCAFIAVDASGENAITVVGGANASVRAADCAHRFGPGDVLVLQMEVPFAEALRVAGTARAGGARIVWNLAPAPADLAASECEALIAATDILVVNEHEARTAALLVTRSAESAEGAAAVLSARGTDVVLTRGARGACLARAGLLVAEAPACPVEVVDTTGAGDTFVGTLAVGLAEGRDPADWLARACLAASLACREAGAQAGMPRRTDLDAPTTGAPGPLSRAPAGP